jgi:acyl-CoA thioester hydrolase
MPPSYWSGCVTALKARTWGPAGPQFSIYREFVAVSNFRETYRGSVAAWECDQYGHMNVQFYTARISDAAASVMLAAGFGQEAFKVHKLGIAAVNAETRFVNELHAGDLIRMESGVTLAEGKKIKFHHRVYNAETGVLCMQADVLALCFDLQARKSVALPADLEDGFKRVQVAADAPAEQVAIPATEDGFVPTGRSPVQPWECDRMGHLNVQFYLSRFAEAEKQLLLALGYGPTRRRDDKVAVRPVRHRIQFRRENHEGAVLRLRSGIRSVEPDRLQLYHELYEAETDTLSATCEATLILDRLDGAGPLALPADVTQAAQALAAQLRAPEPPKPHGGRPLGSGRDRPHGDALLYGLLLSGGRQYVGRRRPHGRQDAGAEYRFGGTGLHHRLFPAAADRRCLLCPHRHA